VKFVHVFAFAILGVFQFASAQTGSSIEGKPIIIDAAQLVKAIERGALVWDVRGADAFAKGRIAGAVNIGDAASVLREPNSEDFIATAQIEKMFSAAGIIPSREIVVYGSRGAWQAYFGLYTMQYFGGQRTSVYHEGFEDWSAKGLNIVQGPSSINSGSAIALKLEKDPSNKYTIGTQEVIARLNKPEVQILDVRTVKEFTGEDIRALRGGHIPGAINIPYENNWIDPDTALKLARKEVTSNGGMSLKPAEGLKALYAKLDPSKETIVYCQSGARASETAGILQHLGFKNVKVYDSSWLAYGNTLEAPAESATFFNVGLLNSRIATMQSRIEQLEKELATKAAK
jgi:thiosulfate/3-mercaptopyruvate sulfurtransferase